jgi:hypothetical protein
MITGAQLQLLRARTARRAFHWTTEASSERMQAGLSSVAPSAIVAGAEAPCGGDSQCGVRFTCSPSHEYTQSCDLDGGCMPNAPDAQAATRDAGPGSG